MTHAIHPDEEDKGESKNKKKNNKKKKNKGKAKETEEPDVTKDPVLGAPVNNTETPDTKEGAALVPGEKPADPVSSPVLEESSPEVKSAEGKSISTVPDGTRVAMAARMPSDVEIAKNMPNSSLRTEQPVPPSSAAQDADGPADGGKVVAAAVQTESKDHTTGDSSAPALTPNLQGDPQLSKHTGATEEIREDAQNQSEDKGPLAAAAGLAGASGIAGLAGAAYVLKNDNDEKKPEEAAQEVTQDKEPAPKPEEVSEAAKAPADKGKVVAATVEDEADTKPLSETTTAPPLSSEAKQEVPDHTGAAVERRDDHSASPDAAGPLETDATAPVVAGAAGVVGGGAGVYAAKESGKDHSVQLDGKPHTNAIIWLGSTPAKAEAPSAAQEPSSELQQHTGAVAERRDDLAPSDAQPGPVQDDATRTAVPDKAGEKLTQKKEESSSVPAAAAAGAGGVGAAAAAAGAGVAAGKHEAPAGVAEAPKSDVVWDPTLAPEAHKTVATGQPPAQPAASQESAPSSSVPKEAGSKAAEAPATPKKDAPAAKEAPHTPAPSAQQQKQEQLQPDSAKSTPGQYATAPSTPQGTPIKDKRKSGLFSKIKVRFCISVCRS